MALVYSENRTSPVVQARLAELELALSQARFFLSWCMVDPAGTPKFRTDAAIALVNTEKALNGTIHSFTPNVASR